MEFVSAKLEPADHIVTGLDEEVPFDNLNGKNGIPGQFWVSDKVLEHDIAILKIKNADVSIGLSDVNLVGVWDGGADWVHSFRKSLRSVDIDLLDYFGGALTPGALFAGGQISFPQSDIAVVATCYCVHDVFKVDENAWSGVDSSCVQAFPAQELLALFLVVVLSESLRNPPYFHEMIWPRAYQILFLAFWRVRVCVQRVNDTSVAFDGHDVLTIFQLEYFDGSGVALGTGCVEVVADKLDSETTQLARLEFVNHLFGNLTMIFVAVKLE